jgi:hypothetical protein
MGEVLLGDEQAFFEDCNATGSAGRYDGVRGQADEGERYGGEGDSESGCHRRNAPNPRVSAAYNSE